MVESEMDHPIRLRNAALQALQILKGASMDFRARGGKSRGLLVRTAKAEHLMSGRDQILDDGGPDPAGRAGDEHTHETGLQNSLETNLCSLRYCSKVVILSYYNG